VPGRELTIGEDGASHRPTPPPYNPGFGIDPPLLAGRSTLLAEFDQALTVGPRSPWFGHCVVGDRGVGKTVLLNAMQGRAQARGWAVVAHQALRGEPLVPPLLEQIVEVAGGTWSKLSKLAKDVDLEVVLGVDVKVARAEARMAPGRRRLQTLSVALRKALTAVGEHAATEGVGLVVTVDEAHAIADTTELAALAAALQMVVKRAGLPVAVYFAGLPHTRQVLRRAGTFIERLGVAEIGEIGDEAAALALVKPAADLGVRVDDDALAFLVEHAAGYPYLVQLVGYHAWTAKGARSTITLADARRGVAAARKEMGELFHARWDPLPPLQQAYLQAAARIGEIAPVSDIAAALERNHTQLASTRAALINDHRILCAPRYGEVAFTIPAFAEWIAGQPDAVGPAIARRPRRE